jgi:hypothetical protein
MIVVQVKGSAAATNAALFGISADAGAFARRVVEMIFCGDA